MSRTPDILVLLAVLAIKVGVTVVAMRAWTRAERGEDPFPFSAGTIFAGAYTNEHDVVIQRNWIVEVKDDAIGPMGR